MASNARDWWRQHRESKKFFIPSPVEPIINSLSLAEQRAAAARNCADEGAKAGARAASVVFVATAVPTIIGARMIPWAKANLNYTAQALIICGATVGTYFVVADKTILKCARTTSYARIQAERTAANRDA